MDGIPSRRESPPPETSRTAGTIKKDAAYMRAVFESVHDAVVTIDERGIIEAVNPAAERVFGYSAEDLVGRNVSVLMPAPYSKDHDNYLQGARSKGDQAVVGFCREVEGLRKDGTTFPAEIAISEMGVGGRRLFTGIVRDISERQRAEAALQESEIRYRGLVETMNEGVAVHDTSGIITYVNPALCGLLQCRRDDFVGRRVMDVVNRIAEEPGRQVIADQMNLRRGGDRTRYEVTVRLRDGSRLDLMISAAPIFDPSGQFRGGLAVIADVTEQRKARQVLLERHGELESQVQQRTRELQAANEQLQRGIAERRRSELQLRESRQRLQDILDSMFVFVGVFTTGGIVVEANRAPLEAAGLRREEVIGKPLHETYWWSYSPKVQAQLQDALKRAAGGETTRYDVPVRVAGDRLITIDVAFSPLYGTDGRVVQIVGTGVDITQRVLAEERARRHQAELAHVSRLNVMGEMATHLAHELNQPLGAIGIFIESVIRRLQSSAWPAQRELETLQKVVDQVHRAGKIIARLRSFTRQKAPRRSSADLNQLVGEVCEFLASETRHQGIELRCLFAESPLTILVDAIQVEQVVLNIIRNAIDAVNEADAVPRELTIRTSKPAENEVEVTVSNPGSRVPDDSLARLFDPFYTTKPEGMGIGLSISRTIIEAHGGRIGATANPEGGLTVYFTLPLGAGRDYVGH